jgi:predicted 2-oxoglutarate/Fe(II)-dependent dioxygenase YbiX
VFTWRPQAGDLVLFPSWILHEVAPTAGDSARVSIAFNIPGSWADTAGVQSQFAIEPDTDPA